MVPTMPFMNSQFTGLIMPSTAFRWGKIHMVPLCALLLMSCIQYSMVSSCTALLDSNRKGICNESLAKLDRMAIAFNKTCRQSIQSSFPRTDFSVELQTSPRSSAPNSLAFSSCLQPLQCKLRDGS
jgi:hypothetical protein